MNTQALHTFRTGVLLLIAAQLLLTGTARADASDDAWRAFELRQQRLQLLGDLAQSSKALSAQIFASGFDSAQSCSADRDGDGLSDCVETGTGVFVNSGDTGTSPELADTDGDGISDGEEVLGTDTGLDLAALGASPLRRDLLIEYDWFDSNYDCGSHSQRPTAAAMERVAAVFANAPISNPDGSTGIHLIQDYGQDSLNQGGNRVDGFDAILPGTFDATYHQIKQANFDAARLGYYRYVLMPHRYGGGVASGGYAEVVGDDAIVSLYCLNSEDNVVRTIIHEVGHLLGLHHGGFEACNDKPNYNSLMNYRFQYYGVDATCDAIGDSGGDDFSSGERISLHEAELHEAEGVCGGPAIDWNRNGTVESALSLDLNPGNDDNCGSGLRRLDDFNDWANLSFYGLMDRSGKLKSIQSETACSHAPEAG